MVSFQSEHKRRTPVCAGRSPFAFPKEGCQTHRDIILEKAGPGFAAAVDTLLRQLEDENATVSHRAAKELVDLFADYVMNGEEREITVRVVGMPPPGMPSPPREEAP